MDFRKHFVAGVLLNGRYETRSPLNHGSFGMVITARDRFTGSLVAVKCLSKSAAAQDDGDSLSIDERSEELTVHTRIGRHPNIVNLLDSFETDTHTYLVLEYCSMGDLYEAIRQDKGPKETEHVREFMLQLVDAIQYLHRKGLYHRDIKPENIFLTESGKMKLGDFGLATTESWSYEAAVGSDRYMAPEQYEPTSSGLSPARADIWSIGICLLNILFSRNPFGIPATTDPLFFDFVRDSQALFDVFPNMSQDTFEVLIHCLAIDPAKRSLSLVKDALQRVVSFTIDDETLDEFCTENRDVIAVTANRQPLRTPSVGSPTFDHGEAFPWAKALHLTSPKTRQLSIIVDDEAVSEDLFPGSEASATDWFYKADTRSIDSTVDSGLGLSLNSVEHDAYNETVASSRPVPINASLNAHGSRPSLGERAGSAIASMFGKKKAFVSKSWSDMWDEEEEEREQLERKLLSKTLPPQFSRLSTLSQEDSEDDGRSTPRPCLAELKNTSSMNIRSPSNKDLDREEKDERISEHTGFMFEESGAQKYSPPTKRSLIDKWAALGDLRRGATGKTSSAPQDKHRFRPSSWRRSVIPARSPDPQEVCQQKDWTTSKDWRRSDQCLPGSPLRDLALRLDGVSDSEDAHGSEDEFVGGWNELHL